MNPDTDAISELLAREGKLKADLARLLELHPARITELLTSDRKLSSVEAAKVARYLNTSTDYIIKIFSGIDLPQSRKKFKVVNYVGAGGEVVPIDDYLPGDGMYEVDLPPPLGPDEDWLVLEVKGDSMYPQMEEGWNIWYARKEDGVPDYCLNRICVAKRIDGKVYVKKLRRGTEKDRYTLESVNASPIENVELVWAAPIAAIVPR